MPTAQEVLRDLLKIHIAPLLRKRGYAGSGQNFSKHIDENWAAINVQRDRYSSADELTFTVNLGTASTVVRLEDGFAATDPAREIECHWRNRLGSLVAAGSDRWWSVRSRMRADEASALGSALAGHLVEVALPMLEAMAPDEAILKAVLDGDEPALGIPPAHMDIVGPILRRLGPADRFMRYLAICDEDGSRSASLYEMFDDVLYAPRLGPVRIRKRLADLSRVGFEPRQQAISDLGYAKPTDEIRTALRPFLGDGNSYLRSAAAQALGRLGDSDVAAQLQAMVNDEPARSTAVHAAFAIAKLDSILDAQQRERSRAVIGERRDRAVGHDRAALSELMRRLDAT